MKKPNLNLLKDIEKGVIQGLDAVAIELKKEMFLNMPVDTGYLRDGAQFGSGGGNEIERKGFTLTVKNEAHYAPYVYYGTKNRQGRPWIEEAVEKIKVQEIIQEAINDAIRKK